MLIRPKEFIKRTQIVQAILKGILKNTNWN